MTATASSASTETFSRADWLRGYESQTEERDYWIDDIEGEIPAELEGTVFRNGPGLLEIGGQSLHHPFDGDGMISAIAIRQGRAYFRNRYVRTEGFLAEQKAGKILYRGVFGTQKPGGWLANIFDLGLKNIANTNILYWGDRLLALWEAAEPHRLDPQTLETFGLDRLDGLLADGDPFSAHPRIDPGSERTGGQRRLVNFAVKTGPSSRIRLYEFDESGRCVEQQERVIPGFAFLHDFALTPNYAVFFQNPIRFNPLPALLGQRTAGQCLASDRNKSTQILVIPRDPKAPLQTFETESCFVFHHANAFETADGAIVVDSVCYDEFPMLEPDRNFKEVDFDSYPRGELFRFTLHPGQPRAERKLLESRTCEFPTQHPRTVGQDARYYYIGAAAAPTGNAPLQSLLKIDLETGDRKLWTVAPRGFIGEPLFVPRPGGIAEDDGWVLSLIYDAARHSSALVILSAQTLEPLARLNLKQHIPYGLHGCFTPQYFGPED